MKRQRAISAGSLARMLQAAAEAWRCQEYQQTIEILERASRLDPANSHLLLDLGRACGMRYDYAAAERCFEKAIRVAPSKLEVLASAAQRSREFGRPEMSQRYLDQAIGQGNAPPEILIALAEILERRHRREDAAQLVDRALKSHPEHAPAQLFRARLNRASDQLETAEQQLRHLLDRSSADPATRAQGWYELGSVLDRQGRYDEAWIAFLEAKALLRPAAAGAIAALHGIQARAREMESAVSAEVLRRWSDSASALQPPRRLAVLGGHPRSGTTLLEQILDSHPDILSAEETHILHDEAYLPLSRGFAPTASILEVLEAAPPTRLRQSRENYFHFTGLFLGEAIGNRVLIDKNPALHVLIPAVARIFPEAKFLVALRDPRDVCLSCFMQPLAINPVSSAYLSVEETVIQYTSVMHLWQALLPRMTSGHIQVRYEDLVENPESTSRRVLDFLELGWNDQVLRFDEHARQKLIRSPTYTEVTQPVFKRAIGRWRNYQRHLEPCLQKLEPLVKAFGY